MAASSLSSTAALRPCAMLLRRRLASVVQPQQVVAPQKGLSHATSAFCRAHRRTFTASSSTTFAAPASSGPASGPRRAKPTGPIRDDAIRARWIMMVDPDSGSLTGPLDPRRILRDLDRARYWLLQVTEGKAGDESAEHDEEEGKDDTSGERGRPSPATAERYRRPSDRPSREESDHRGTRGSRDSGPPPPDENGTYSFLPIVKLVEKKAEFDKARELKRKAKERAAGGAGDSGSAASAPPKEIQLSWSVTPNDLRHKLIKARDELTRKGVRVRVDIITRKGGPRVVAGGEQAKKREALIKSIEEELCREEDATGGAEEGLSGTEASSDTPKSPSAPFTAKVVRTEWKSNGSVCRLYFEATKRKR